MNGTIVENFFASIPDKCTKFHITIYGEGNDVVLGTRNPAFFVCSGDNYDAIYKLYGNTDIYRPMTNDTTYDLEALKISNGTINSYTKKLHNYLILRLNGNTDKANNGYATITFS